MLAFQVTVFVKKVGYCRTREPFHVSSHLDIAASDSWSIFPPHFLFIVVIGESHTKSLLKLSSGKMSFYINVICSNFVSSQKNFYSYRIFWLEIILTFTFTVCHCTLNFSDTSSAVVHAQNVSAKRLVFVWSFQVLLYGGWLWSDDVCCFVLGEFCTQILNKIHRYRIW